MPHFADRDGELEKREYTSKIISTLFICGTLFSLILFLSVGFFRQVFFSQSNLDLYQSALPLFQVMVWITPFAITATILGSVWYYYKKFTLFPLAQLFGTVASLLTTLILYSQFGIWSLVVGFMVNVISQFLFIAPRSMIRIRLPDFSLSIPLLLSWAPLIISNFAVRSDTLLMRSFASDLGVGQLVYVNLVTKMYSLGSGIVTIGIQVLLLPHLLERISRKQFKETNLLVIKAKLMGIILSVLSSLAIFYVGPLILKYLFLGGKFSSVDLENTNMLFPVFLAPSFAWGLNNLFFQPLIALKKTWVLGGINVISLMLAWITTLRLFSVGWGVWAISVGLCVLLFGGIIMSEIVWQIEKKKILI